MANSVDFSKKSIVVVTGASKGIGREIAVELAGKLNQNSTLILLARSHKGLEETKSLVLNINKSIAVYIHPKDLSKPNSDEYDKLFQNISQSTDISGTQFGVIFHNAGSIGILKETTELTDLKTWQEYYDLNLFSVALLNSVFIKHLRPIVSELAVINITSLCGRTPFVNLGMYGSGKAARELFFKVLAIEEPNISVLNYSPGPVDTDMFSTIIEEAQSDELKQSFKTTNPLTTDETVTKLLGILEKGDFKTGDTVDYFDRV